MRRSRANSLLLSSKRLPELDFSSMHPLSRSHLKPLRNVISEYAVIRPQCLLQLLTAFGISVVLWGKVVPMQNSFQKLTAFSIMRFCASPQVHITFPGDPHHAQLPRACAIFPLAGLDSHHGNPALPLKGTGMYPPPPLLIAMLAKGRNKGENKAAISAEPCIRARVYSRRNRRIISGGLYWLRKNSPLFAF